MEDCDLIDKSKTRERRAIARRAPINSSVIIMTIKTLVAAVVSILSVILAACSVPSEAAGHLQASQSEFQLQAAAGALVRLPCLIGKRAHCGEPYFIAWYKLNVTDRQWNRIEALSPADQLEAAALRRVSGQAFDAERPAASSRPLADRVQFEWSPRPQDVSSAASSTPTASSCLESVGLLNQSAAQGGSRSVWPMSSQRLPAASLQLFDCAQLTIRPVALQDEGQYKCDITFSETVEFERCPVSTSSQLHVIARPSEPELFLNGRPALSLTGNELTFKEGAQVRLECRSAGGKPPAQIEWLNLTTWTAARTGNPQLETTQSGAPATTMRELAQFNDDNDDQSMIKAADQLELAHLMRLQWPAKRATYSTSAYDLLTGTQASASNNIDQGGPPQAQHHSQLIPVTSSSVMITLSRHDLRSRFACLVWPQTSSQNSFALSSAPEATSLNELPVGLRSAHALNQAAEQTPMLASSRLNAPDGPMLKWVQLDVLAKPTGVSVRVLELIQSADSPSEQQVKLMHQSSGASGRQSFYSLQPNRLYAIQCLVDQSRPRSQVAWFNGSEPLELPDAPIELKKADYLLTLASRRPQHRLTSFVRHVEQEPRGTVRTISTLLLTTNFHDNFQELSCRASSEAFAFDELLPEAPIASIRIYVNYPPSAWLEAAEADWQQTARGGQTQVGRVSLELGSRLQLRCLVGANPLAQNTIVQVDWLRDGRKLTHSSASGNGTSPRVLIERANHLHMPIQPHHSEPSAALANSARLLVASSLTIAPLAQQDAGLYTCQFKLIPAPSTTGFVGLQQVANVSGGGALQPMSAPVSAQARIISGQSIQAIQLAVIEAKLPIVRIASSSGLFVYDHDDDARQRSEVVVADANADLTIKCDLVTQTKATSQVPGVELSRRFLWLLDDKIVHSGSLDLLVLRGPAHYGADAMGADQGQDSIRRRLVKGNGARLSCAQEMLEPAAVLAAPGNFHAQSMRLFSSSNQIRLIFKTGPKLVHSQGQDLMPSVKSVSELDLINQPTRRLKFVCLAECEPICVINWLINERSLASGQAKHEELASAADELALGNQTALRFFKRLGRLEARAPVDSLETSGATFDMIETDNLGELQPTGGSPFAWARHTSLEPVEPLSGEPQLEPASRKLANNSKEFTSTANVISSLELSYGQISQLLRGAAPNQQAGGLNVECKLDETLGGRQKFGSSWLKPDVFYPSLRRTGEHLELAPIQLSGDQANLRKLFERSGSETAARTRSLQSRIVLKKSIPPVIVHPTLAPPGDDLVLQNLLEQQQQQTAGSPGAILNQLKAAQNTTSNHNYLQQPQQPQGLPGPSSNLSPLFRSWLTGHQEALLACACLLALIWLTFLVVGPLMRRHLRRSAKFGFGCAPNPSDAQDPRNKLASNWRFNSTNQSLFSRASSINEINQAFGANNTGGLDSSSTLANQHYKRFVQQRAQPLSSLGAAAVANYYGAPESNGADSSEHDMVQSCSQSSNYEDFTHQQRFHQQPLYFNQAQLIESTTLSRVAPSSLEQQPAQRSTMRNNNLSNVPLISGHNRTTTSRIHFNDLQHRHSIRGSLADHTSSHYTFGKTLGAANQRRAGNQTIGPPEHIYDHVG